MLRDTVSLHRHWKQTLGWRADHRLSRAVARAVLAGALLTVVPSSSYGDETDGLLSGSVDFHFRQDGDTRVFLNVTGDLLLRDLMPTIPVTTAPWAVGADTLSWRSPLTWDPAFNVIQAANWTKTVYDAQKGIEHINPVTIVGNVVKMHDLLNNWGPTERSASHTFSLRVDDITNDVDIAPLGLNVGVSVEVPLRYHAIIGSDTSVNMDQQDVTLQALTVEHDAYLIGNPTMEVYENVTNLGTLTNFGGVVRGDLVNTATVAGGGGVYVSDSSTIHGQLNNTGDIWVQSGSLNLPSATANAGTLVVADGVLNCGGRLTNLGTGTVWLQSGTLKGAGGLLNAGAFEWTGGTISDSGGVTNMGSHFTITGSAEKVIASRNTLTNCGTIRQGGDAVVTMTGYKRYEWSYPAFIHNLSDGLYDLQGDGQILLGEEREGHSSISWQYNTVRNAGTFRKSGGAGQSMIEAQFENTGAVEVLSGTLALASPWLKAAPCICRAAFRCERITR